MLALSIAATLVSGYILWFVLPRGSGIHGHELCSMSGYGFVGNYWTALGWPRYMWIDVHNWASVVLLCLIILHISMHWKWIIETLKRVKTYFSGTVRKVREQFIASVALFILFVADCFSGFVIWLILPRGTLDYYYMLSGAGRTFWGLQRNVWVDIHTWLATLIVAIVIIHIILNRRWLVEVSKKISNRVLEFFKRKESTGIER